MFRLITAVILATLPLAPPAAEELHAAPQVVAMETQRAIAPPTRAPLEACAGVYRTADGAPFVVATIRDI